MPSSRRQAAARGRRTAGPEGSQDLLAVASEALGEALQALEHLDAVEERLEALERQGDEARAELAALRSKLDDERAGREAAEAELGRLRQGGERGAHAPASATELAELAQALDEPAGNPPPAAPSGWRARRRRL
jgi:hypothetical protein